MTPVTEFIPFLPDWTSIARRCREQLWAREVLNSIRADFMSSMSRVSIPAPERLSHRYHTYFCDADGAKLRFDDTNPFAHQCPSCGKVHSGDPYDGAWIMQMHNAAVCQAERAAILTRLGDSETAATARTALESIVDHYARHYRDYPVHGDRPPMQGRIQPHGLNEAVWQTEFMRVLRWSGQDVQWTGEKQSRLHDMARAVVELLQPQIHEIHNHEGWKLAALAGCAALLKDDALMRWCRDSEFGMEAQVRRGFRDDGFWFEGSVTYHFYMLNAVLSYWEAAGDAAFREPSSLRKLTLAVNNAARLAYSDGRMPAYSDGWINTTLSSYAHLAEAAWARLGDAVLIAPYYHGETPRRVQLASAADDSINSPTVAAHRSSTWALVAGPSEIAAPEPERESFVLRESGIAILKNNALRLGMRFGPDGGGHDHRDKLNVDVEVLAGWRSLDLGTSGYDSKFTHWLGSPVAHNLIVIDGMRQPPHSGRLVAFSPERIVAASDCGPVRMQRAIQLKPTGWRDEYRVALDAERRIEWAFHGDGIFVPEVPHGPGAAVELNDDGGYRWLRDVKQLESGTMLRGEWILGSVRVGLTLPIPTGFTIFLAQAPGNADQRPMSVVLIRGTGREALFDATFEIRN